MQFADGFEAAGFVERDRVVVERGRPSLNSPASLPSESVVLAKVAVAAFATKIWVPSLPATAERSTVSVPESFIAATPLPPPCAIRAVRR